MEPRALATIEINPDFNWFRFSFVGDIVGIFSTATANTFLRLHESGLHHVRLAMKA